MSSRKRFKPGDRVRRRLAFFDHRAGKVMSIWHPVSLSIRWDGNDQHQIIPSHFVELLPNGIERAVKRLPESIDSDLCRKCQKYYLESPGERYLKVCEMCLEK